MKASASASTKNPRPKGRVPATFAAKIRGRAPPHFILFDIDGTLVLTGGAGGRAMSRAFEDVFCDRQRFRRDRHGGPHRRLDTQRRGRCARNPGRRLHPHTISASLHTASRNRTREARRRAQGADARRSRTARRACAARRHLSSRCSPATTKQARASSSNTSISGNTFHAARSGIWRRIATCWCPRRSPRWRHAAALRSLPGTRSSSAIHRSTSAAPRTSAPDRSPSRRAVIQSTSCARQERMRC